MDKLKKVVKDFCDEDERRVIVIAALTLDDEDVEAIEFISQTGNPVLIRYVHEQLVKDLEKKGLIKRRRLDGWGRGFLYGALGGILTTLSACGILGLFG